MPLVLFSVGSFLVLATDSVGCYAWPSISLVGLLDTGCTFGTYGNRLQAPGLSIEVVLCVRVMCLFGTLMHTRLSWTWLASGLLSWLSSVCRTWKSDGMTFEVPFERMFLLSMCMCSALLVSLCSEAAS